MYRSDTFASSSLTGRDGSIALGGEPRLPRPVWVASSMSSGAAPALCLLGGPYVIEDSQLIELPEGSMRLLVFIALRARRVDRRVAAGTLWPNGGDERAAGNLRSALWRLKCAGIEFLHADKFAIWLDPDTEVDVRVLDRWAGRIIEGRARPDDLCVPPLAAEAMDLLPGWYDDWVIFERERLRQRLLHALESLSRNLVEAGQYAQAIEVALTAVQAEPLRESAHRRLLEAHLAEGNLVEARRHFRDYLALVQRELGVDPSPALTRLIDIQVPDIAPSSTTSADRAAAVAGDTPRPRAVGGVGLA